MLMVAGVNDGPPRRWDHGCQPMNRKQNSTTEPAEHRVFVTHASIQYLRTGARRRTSRKVGTVPGVRPFFA
jgi:hypothetical protein